LSQLAVVEVVPKQAPLLALVVVVVAGLDIKTTL
jgi:hypothetical protein